MGSFYNELFGVSHKGMDFYRRLYKAKAVTYNPETEKFIFDTKGLKDLVDCARLWKMTKEIGISAATEFYQEICIAGEGPKIFELDSLDQGVLEMWEGMEIRLRQRDFVAPFATTIIELPKRYVQDKIVKNEFDGEMHRPRLVIIRWEPKNDFIFGSVIFDSREVFTYALIKPEETFVEAYVMWDQNGLMSDSVAANKDEEKLSRRIMNMGLNACLFFCEPQTQVTGRPQNEKWVRKLRERREFDLAAMQPILYEWSGMRPLRDRTNKMINKVQVGERASPELHWVHGAWKMQPYGPKSSLRKRIHVMGYLRGRDL